MINNLRTLSIKNNWLIKTIITLNYNKINNPVKMTIFQISFCIGWIKTKVVQALKTHAAIMTKSFHRMMLEAIRRNRDYRPMTTN